MTGPGRLVHLDMLRGLAALLVVAGHLRALLFVPYGELQAPGLIDRLFYAGTGLGHQAVLAFFALSGYLVGGKALLDMRRGRFLWSHYLVARFTRLWVVVLPALLLTLAWDMLGFRLGGGEGYAGKWYAAISAGPSLAQPADHSLRTLIGNALFLQTIAVPVYGSNGPLWSLANEFWYYMVVPAAAAALMVPQPAWQRVALLIAATLITVSLPPLILILGSVWVAGAAIRLLGDLQPWHTWLSHTAMLSASALLVAAGAVVSKTGRGGIAGDLVLGLGFALMLPGLATLRPFDGIYRLTAVMLSEISLTLYATHFPLLAMLWYVFMAPARHVPGAIGFAQFTGGLALAIVSACVLWVCFERHTLAIRRAVIAALGLKRDGIGHARL